MEIYTSWINLKSFITDKALDIFYTEYPHKYIIYTIYEQTKFYVELWKTVVNCEGLDIEQNNINITDFETNFKNNSRII